MYKSVEVRIDIVPHTLCSTGTQELGYSIILSIMVQYRLVLNSKSVLKLVNDVHAVSSKTTTTACLQITYRTVNSKRQSHGQLGVIPKLVQEEPNRHEKKSWFSTTRMRS